MTFAITQFVLAAVVCAFAISDLIVGRFPTFKIAAFLVFLTLGGIGIAYPEFFTVTSLGR